jgi:hypothetical protein
MLEYAGISSGAYEEDSSTRLLFVPGDSKHSSGCCMCNNLSIYLGLSLRLLLPVLFCRV